MENGVSFRIKRLNGSEVQIVHHDKLMKQPIQPNGSTEGNISRETVMDKIKPQQFEVNEEQNEKLHTDDSLESIDESGLTPSFTQPLTLFDMEGAA